MEQVTAGWTVYARQCGECHGPGLDGMEAPPLRGVDFLNGWAGRTTDELFAACGAVSVYRTRSLEEGHNGESRDEQDENGRTW